MRIKHKLLISLAIKLFQKNIKKAKQRRIKKLSSLKSSKGFSNSLKQKTQQKRKPGFKWLILLKQRHKTSLLNLISNQNNKITIKHYQIMINFRKLELPKSHSLVNN